MLWGPVPGRCPPSRPSCSRRGGWALLATAQRTAMVPSVGKRSHSPHPGRQPLCEDPVLRSAQGDRRSVVTPGDRCCASEAFSLGKQSPTTFTSPTRLPDTETGPSARQPDAEQGRSRLRKRAQGAPVCSTGGSAGASGAEALRRGQQTGVPPLFSRGKRSQNWSGGNEPHAAEGGLGLLMLSTALQSAFR